MAFPSPASIVCSLTPIPSCTCCFFAPPQVDKAVDMIERLLEPNDDTLNEHKRLQLRELAALNGTLKDEVVGAVWANSTGCYAHRAVGRAATQGAGGAR